MTQAIISNEYEVETFEAIERMEYATAQFKKLIKDYTTYQAHELEPLFQQILTVEHANTELRTVIEKTRTS